MKPSTADNHKQRLVSKVTAIYEYARYAGQDHETILTRLTEEVWNDPGLAKCPSRVRTYLSDLSQRLLRELHLPPHFHANQLEQMLADARAGKQVGPLAYLRFQHRLDGEYVTSDQVSERSRAGDTTAWDRLESAHVWNHLPANNFNPWKNVKE